MVWRAAFTFGRKLFGTASRILGLDADVTRLSDLERVVKATFDSFGGADIVFNNAGGPKPGGAL